MATVVGVAIGAAISNLNRSKEDLPPGRRVVRTLIEELAENPLFPARPVQRIANSLGLLTPTEVVRELDSVMYPREFIGKVDDDPRVQMERYQGVCDRATVRKDAGVTPSGHTGDLVTGQRCVIDYEPRRTGGPIRL